MPTLYTIGHSNRQLAEFTDLLNHYAINFLIDIRTIPKSKNFPWFNQNEIRNELNKLNIHYLHFKDLGGLRQPHKESINMGWHNTSFRGYADYMQTPTFFAALKELNTLLTKDHRVAVMCAEALPWRCHRSLLSDAEIIRHITVKDIISKTSLLTHKLTSFAVIEKHTRPMKLYYPAIQSSLNF